MLRITTLKPTDEYGQLFEEPEGEIVNVISTGRNSVTVLERFELPELTDEEKEMVDEAVEEMEADLAEMESDEGGDAPDEPIEHEGETYQDAEWPVYDGTELKDDISYSELRSIATDVGVKGNLPKDEMLEQVRDEVSA